MDPKYPNVNVQMVGQDGNAFAIMGRVQRELRRAGISREEIDAFATEATAGNYDHLLATVTKWVSVDGDEGDADWDEYDDD